MDRANYSGSPPGERQGGSANIKVLSECQFICIWINKE